VTAVDQAGAESDPLGREYQAALAHLRKPRRVSQGLLLVGTLALFLLLQQSGSGAALLILVSVLLFHEAGHFVGMRLFGYRDMKMFFIPLFGAAVSGKRGDIAAWKEGIVLLLGPVPGIALGAAIGFAMPQASPAVREVALTLLSINIFNLLPIGGLDGARLLELVLFSRRRWLAVAFQTCTGLAAAALALTWGNIGLGVMAAFMLLLLPYRWRILKAADRIVRANVALPVEAAALEGETGRALFVEARGVVREDYRSKAPYVAAAMQQVLDAARTKRPSAEASIVLGTVLAAAFLFGVAALLVLTNRSVRLPAL
jgi:Zn-dependent protease